MNRITLTLAMGRRTDNIVEAWEVAPGLAVHRDVDEPELWCVSHVRSGAVLTETYDGPEHAAYLAGLIADMADWTLPGKAIKDAFNPYGDELYVVVPRPYRTTAAEPEVIAR